MTSNNITPHTHLFCYFKCFTKLSQNVAGYTIATSQCLSGYKYIRSGDMWLADDKQTTNSNSPSLRPQLIFIATLTMFPYPLKDRPFDSCKVCFVLFSYRPCLSVRSRSNDEYRVMGRAMFDKCKQYSQRNTQKWEKPTYIFRSWPTECKYRFAKSKCLAF